MSRPTLLTESDLTEIQATAYRGMIDKHLLQCAFGVSEKTIDRVIKKLGLTHVSQHLIDITKRYLAGERVLDLVKEYGISQPAIHAFFRRHGIEARGARYVLNHAYFENIDSEEKAYFLGFIFADGCVYKNRLRISLSAVDTPILNRFSESIGSNKPVHFGKPSSSYPNATWSCSIELVSDRFIADLTRWGVLPNKTESATFPEAMIGNPFLRDFLRGYVDGDGSFGRYLSNGRHTKHTLNACGTEAFLSGMRKVFREVATSNGHLSKRHKESPTCCMTLAYSGGRTVKTLLDYLYKDSKVYLNRKYEKYVGICA